VIVKTTSMGTQSSRSNPTHSGQHVSNDVPVSRVRAPQDARGRVNILADAGKVTLGPKGRNVILERSYGAPNNPSRRSVAKEIELNDSFERHLGSQMVNEVSSKTSDVAGERHDDPTVLAQSIVK